MKKFIATVLIIVVLTGGVYAFYRWQKYQKEEAPPEVEISSINSKNVTLNKLEPGTTEIKKNSDPSTQNENLENAISNTVKPMEVAIPPTLNLKMDFFAQAPFGNWDYPWQEACEEATTLLIANTYFKHQWTASEFNEEILKLVEWEKKQFGAYEHTDMNQTEKILNDYLKLETKIHENPTYQDVQNILAQGHLIVMPLAGKQIPNPFYKNGGPIYHVLVVKGYKENQKIITNDVGTRNGENYIYTWETLQKALHDYAEPINQGEKKIIEIFPPNF